ncbi:MAG: hypothetical protein EXX96DRAFT_632509 [Benjaminiella poitrasii]|nr:MAG: hypothetical protein EXX96DRAFT_632509 [Benjaminiella poitrasii]
MTLEPSIHNHKTILCIILTFIVGAFAEQQEHTVDPKSLEFWGQIVAIVCLIILSGVVAGLTLGLMSLDTTNLAILKVAGTPQQQHYASRIIPIRENGHILLTTLLLTNTVLNETLPILFDDIFSKGFISVILSTVLLVLFSEIIPQAVFSKHGLAIGAFFAIPVRILIAIWFVVAWPISKFLDTLLGKHTGITYDAAELHALVGLHDKSKSEHGSLQHRTVVLVQNALSMQSIFADQLAIPTKEILLLPSDTSINSTKVLEYIKDNYTHIFVYDELKHENEIIGILNLKSLIGLKDHDFTESIGKMKLEACIRVSSDTPMIEVLAHLVDQDNESQMVVVYRSRENKEINEKIQITTPTPPIKRRCVSNRISCFIRRMFSKACHVCESTQDTEERTIDSTEQETIESTIDAGSESGLIGVITITNVLSQLMCNQALKK